MPLKVIDATPKQRDSCTPERLERLKAAGIKTDGHIDSLRDLIMKNGYPLPSQEGEHFGFIFRTPVKNGEKEQVFTRLYLTYVDACADEILILVEYKMI